MKHPRIAFCITCKGRSFHLKSTLPKNLADNADYKNCVFIVLDYSSDDDLLRYLAQNHWKEIKAGRLVVYSFRDAERFHMAHAKNMSHRCGMLEGADILCNLDADNYTEPGFASYIASVIHSPHDYLAVDKVIPGVTPRGVTGRIVVHKVAFLNSGGYDEKFASWSPDDKDFNHRLHRMGYRQNIIDKKFLNCIRHNDDIRFKEYPDVHDAVKNDYECIINNENAVKHAKHTVVNFGDIGCGTVYRNYGETPIVLDKLPTRIFGIGMHKTGTTSLSNALTILGFDSAHWLNPRWARNIWEEMATQGKSSTAERHYAISDLPLPLLYKELDRAYPNSKFILTVREEVDWLTSVRDHWNALLNIFRDTWNNDCFTHKVHTLLYGRKMFDPLIFLNRYRRHNEEVKEYFKDRPDDLLILGIDEPRRWEKLCAFLKCDVPTVEYPRSNEKLKIQQ